MSSEHLSQVGFNGYIAPIPDYENVEPWCAQNDVEAALQTTYCDALGLPPIRGIEVLNGISEVLFENVGNNFLIVETRSLASRVAGIDSFGLWGSVGADGQSSSHIYPQDVDIHLLTRERGKRIIELARQGMERGVGKMLSHPTLQHLTPHEIKLSDKNVWDMPSYLKLHLYYFRKRQITPFEVHHQKLNGQGFDELFANYQPYASSEIGAPIYTGIPNSKDGSLMHHILNLHSTSSHWGNHVVYLTAPKIFDNTVFCIPSITRVVAGALSASVITGTQAGIDPKAMDIMKNATSHYGPVLSDKQRVKAQKRLNTMLWRMGCLQHSVNLPNSELNHLSHQIGDFQIFLLDHLHQIGWLEKILPKGEAEKYLKLLPSF